MPYPLSSRDARGEPASPIGAALDRIMKRSEAA